VLLLLFTHSDPVRDVILVASHARNDMYLMDPDDPLSPLVVFGRFRVVDYASATLAVLVRHVDSPIYAIRL